LVVFGARARWKIAGRHDGGEEMGPLPIRFDWRTRQFESERPSFHFMEITAAERAPQRCRSTEFRYESVMQKRFRAW